ncbi:hypothetical protein ACWEWL_16650 [Streptomyces rochei]|uniref:hypothetical protein n=1 Tax=unclassified Streptomyces TaxID=2593676 RepID=UPI000786669E|nr:MULTISPECIES: hypothetical protein [Streptomyces]KYK16173.1 hypothetical protein AUW26_18205 [Streptomyces sp. CC71]PVD06240.1 hypothetical protein DBP22_25610 [Streptomyces sp. CS207]
MPVRIRLRGLAASAALVAASALALAGCGDGSTGAQADERPATATAAQSPSASPTPTPAEAPATTEPATPAVTLPDHTGREVGGAVLAAKAAHIDYTVRLQGTGRQAATWDLDEEVCEQTDGPDGVTFTVPRDGRDCAGRLLHTPEPVPTPAPERMKDTGTGGTGGGTGACELTSPAGNCYADGQFCAKKHRGLSTHGRGGEYLTCEPDSGGTWRWSDGVVG